jgi:hypothetical protein
MCNATANVPSDAVHRENKALFTRQRQCSKEKSTKSRYLQLHMGIKFLYIQQHL